MRRMQIGEGGIDPRLAAKEGEGPSDRAPVGIVTLVPAEQGAYDELTLADVLRTLYRGKWILAAVLAVSVGIQVYLVRGADHLYSATIVVVLVEPPSHRLNSALTELVQLQGYPGLRRGSLDMYITTLRSTRAADRLANDPVILRTIFASEWNPVQGVWREPRPSGPFATVRAFLLKVLGAPAWQPPDARKLADFVNEKLEVEEDPASDIVRVSLTLPDSQFASQLLLLLHQISEDILIEDERESTKMLVDFIEDRLRTASVVDYRTMLASLLVEYEMRLMMLGMEMPVSARLVDGPFVSFDPASPRPLLSLVIAAVAGLVVGLVAVFLRFALWPARDPGRGPGGSRSA